MSRNVVTKEDLERGFLSVCGDLEHNIDYLEQILESNENNSRLIQEMKYQIKAIKALGS